MPLKLAPYRPQQLAFAIGSAILMATGTLLGSSAAVAEVITDAERNAEALQPELPQYLRSFAEPAASAPASSGPAVEAPPAATTPAAAEPDALEDAAQVEEQAESVPAQATATNDVPDIVQPEPAAPEAAKTSEHQPVTDLRADKSLAPPEPIVPALFDTQEVDEEAAAAYSEPTTGSSIAIIEEEPAEQSAKPAPEAVAEIVSPSAEDVEAPALVPPPEAPETSNAEPALVLKSSTPPEPPAANPPKQPLDLTADKQFDALPPQIPVSLNRPVGRIQEAALPEAVEGPAPLTTPAPVEQPDEPELAPMDIADEADLTAPAPVEQEVTETAESAFPDDSKAPAVAEMVKAPDATPAPMAAQLPEMAPPVLPAQGLRVYYAAGNAQLSEREISAVEAFCAEASAHPDSVVDVHVSMPNAEAIRLVALRQDELRAVFSAKGVGGERLRFRLAPFDVNAPGSPGVPLAPHYAEFRLIEKY